MRAGTLDILGPGAWFGEIAVLDGGVRTATVVAISEVTVWEISQDDLTALFKSNGAFALALTAEALRRMRGQARRDTKFALVETAASFESGLREMLSEARTQGVGLGVALVDIDHFKTCNDTYGHRVGDEVIAVVAKRLCSSLRPTDRVARWGGEEFAVAVGGLTTVAEMEKVAERLRAAVATAPLTTSAGAVQLTVSVGMVGLLLDACEAARATQRLIEEADRLLYQAKVEGRNCARCAWHDAPAV
jgi:diguanylate cyclase (GGDEF)-like protein